MFIEILNNNKITVKDPAGKYSPSTFYKENGQIMVDNPEFIGPFPHPKFNKSPLLFDKHIEKMMSENLQIIVD